MKKEVGLKGSNKASLLFLKEVSKLLLQQKYPGLINLEARNKFKKSGFRP
jgi:hypothetical protein